MSDIFRDLTVKQKKDIIAVPKRYNPPIVLPGSFGRKEEHIGTILLRVIDDICQRNLKHHKEHCHEGL